VNLAEHVAPQDPRADAVEAALREIVIDTAKACTLSLDTGASVVPTMRRS